jgi:altronate dehydratase small subunit
MNDGHLLYLDPKDNVCTATSAIENGTRVEISGHSVVIKQTIPLGFKIACSPIAIHDRVIKYGVPIGSATRDIAIGDMVHVHNLKSDYLPTFTFDSNGQP